MPVRIKICGVKHPPHALLAAQAGAHAIGLNFAPGSKRFIGGVDRLIGSVEYAAKLLRVCSNARLGWAGVFVNPELDELLKLQETLKLDILQLHGDESPEFIRRLKARAGSVKVWKAFRVAAQSDLLPIADFECDGILLDAKIPGGAQGGTGQTFDWGILKDFKRTVPLILSGGLTPQNVAAAVRAVKPDWVDVASGVERIPGEKSAELITDFLCAAKNADQTDHS